MKIVYANATWFVLLSLGMVMAGIHRHTTQFWDEMRDVRLHYDLLYGSLAIFLAICAVALFRRKMWGYAISLMANAMLGLLPLSIFIASLYFFSSDLTVIQQFKIHFTNLILSVISLLFWLLLWKSKSKLVSEHNFR